MDMSQLIPLLTGPFALTVFLVWLLSAARSDVRTLVLPMLAEYLDRQARSVERVAEAAETVVKRIDEYLV